MPHGFLFIVKGQINFFNSNLYEGPGGGDKFAPQAVFRDNSKTVGARLMKLCGFYY